MNLKKMKTDPNVIVADFLRMALEDGVKRCDERIAIVRDCGIKLLEDSQQDLRETYIELKRFIKEGAIKIEWIGVKSRDAETRDNVSGCADSDEKGSAKPNEINDKSLPTWP